MIEITLDIETLPCTDPDLIAELTAGIKPPGSMKKWETIQKWEQEERPQAIADAIARTALDGTYGRIGCIGWSIGDKKAHSLVGPAEPELLETFYAVLDNVLQPQDGAPQTPLWIGHNIVGFDLSFLRKRSIILGIRPPRALEQAMHARAWDPQIADTMLMWDSDRERRISLDRLCKVLNIPSPKANGIDGSKIAELFATGEYDRIGSYCCDDVVAARRCYRAMTYS